MSKIKKWTNDYDVPLLDCGHLYQIKDDLAWRIGDRVVCPTCADTEKRVKAARREALECEGRAWQILKNLLERAMPEEGQLWEILISEPEYDTFKDLIETITKLLEEKP